MALDPDGRGPAGGVEGVMGLKFSVAAETFTEHPNGSRSFLTPDAFGSVARVERCPCEDGRARNAFATAEADTFFTIPACVYVGKKTVSGFLTRDEQGWEFTVNQQGKNASLITSNNIKQFETKEKQ
jgi:hypothetical protein